MRRRAAGPPQRRPAAPRNIGCPRRPAPAQDEYAVRRRASRPSDAQMGPVTMRSSLLSGAATMAATLTILATTLATDADAYAQAIRGAASAAPGGTALYWMSAETGSG